MGETGRSPKWVVPRLVKVEKYPSKSRCSSTICLATGNGEFRKLPHGIGNRDGVIIVDHGSRRKESNLMLDEFVAMFREKNWLPNSRACSYGHSILNSWCRQETPRCVIYYYSTSWPSWTTCGCCEWPNKTLLKSCSWNCRWVFSLCRHWKMSAILSNEKRAHWGSLKHEWLQPAGGRNHLGRHLLTLCRNCNFGSEQGDGCFQSIGCWNAARLEDCKILHCDFIPGKSIGPGNSMWSYCFQHLNLLSLFQATSKEMLKLFLIATQCAAGHVWQEMYLLPPFVWLKCDAYFSWCT